MNQYLNQGDVKAVYSILLSIAKVHKTLDRARSISNDNLSNLDVEIHLKGDGVEDVEPFDLHFIPTGTIKLLIISRCLIQLDNLKQGLEFMCLSSGRQAPELIELGRKCVDLHDKSALASLSFAQWDKGMAEIKKIEEKFFKP